MLSKIKEFVCYCLALVFIICKKDEEKQDTVDHYSWIEPFINDLQDNSSFREYYRTRLLTESYELIVEGKVSTVTKLVLNVYKWDVLAGLDYIELQINMSNFKDRWKAVRGMYIVIVKPINEKTML